MQSLCVARNTGAAPGARNVERFRYVMGAQKFLELRLRKGYGFFRGS